MGVCFLGAVLYSTLILLTRWSVKLDENHYQQLKSPIFDQLHRTHKSLNSLKIFTYVSKHMRIYFTLCATMYAYVYMRRATLKAGGGVGHPPVQR